MYQEIQKTSPIETSIRFLPMVGAGIALNVAGGILVARISALWLFLAGCIGGAASAALLAALNPAWAYYKGLLWVMCLAVSPDLFFSAAQLIACSSVGPRRAALAGSLFNITVRLATSIGLALTNSIASTVTNHYSGDKTSPEALLKGYRAAVWFCFASSVLAAILALVYLRDVGIVAKTEQDTTTTSNTHNNSREESPTTVDDVGSINMQVFRRSQDASWASDKGA
jgi:MFS family permease